MRWSDMSGRRRAVLLGLGSAELALTGAAAVDLWRRPQREIHGWKGVWWLGIFVQPFGPIAYLAYGRRRGRGR
ncbi:PLDc N-terminal domain-containing protein [Nonomuraea sp. NPDC003560]|uniref:PLDc N-terminal domain-containing protein n=1 Tax=Nonomuraea sp. NPDC003560 TaxID=3364341 RepID=UPI0036D0E3E4